jgi:hypothetical protein
MQQREAAKPPTSRDTQRQDPANCTQCGDALDAERLSRLARGERVMCRDCAFDAMPCTD